MSRTPPLKNKPSRAKTLLEVHNAVNDVQRAARPRLQSMGEALSWLVALSAGAGVVWRGYQGARAANATLDAQAQADEERVQKMLVQSQTPPAQRPAPPIVRPARSRASGSNGVKNGDGKADKPASAANRKPVAGVFGVAKEFVQRAGEDEIATRALALSFVGVLSLVPLLLLALAALGFFIKDPQQAADLVQRFVTQLLPGKQAAAAASQIIQETHVTESARTLMNGSPWALAGGLASLLWAGISLFVTAADPMNKAWDVTESRSFFKLRLTCLAVLLGAGLFFALSLVVTSFAHGTLARFGLSDQLPVVADLLIVIIAALLNAVMFVLIYRFLPDAPVSWKSALVGGLTAGVLWELFKQGFAMYLAHFANFNKLYGALGGVFLLLTWLYYSCILLLAGAIVCKIYQEHIEGGVTRKAG